MTVPREVTLETAEPGDAPALSCLLELYIHDLSEVFAVDIGEDGRFGYDGLPLYWSEKERRFPFLIRAGGRLAGFVLAKRGSPATDDPADLDVAEFFVLRRNRREGVGRRAAVLLWNRLPGHWIVRVSEGNRGALPFWSDVISAYTGGAFSRRTLPGSPHPWSVLAFESVLAR